MKKALKKEPGSKEKGRRKGMILPLQREKTHLCGGVDNVRGSEIGGNTMQEEQKKGKKRGERICQGAVRVKFLEEGGQEVAGLISR